MPARLLHTLSFWSAVAGMVALLRGRRREAAICWRLCGWGGIGAVYGAYCGVSRLPVEPLAVLRHYWRYHEREIALSFAWHFAFLVLAELVDP